MRLLEPTTVGSRPTRNRLLFGPHVTNLGRGRALSERHVAYYRRRAAGGCGVIVVEEASVHDSDWPYERAPLAADCVEGWATVAAACRAEGALTIAALGHAGGQGVSAYSQKPLWAPSRVPEVATREVPKWMEAADIAAVVAGFGAAAKLAVEAGCDGVEVNAGQHSLVRQFLSGLTNHRGDEWGGDKLRLARDVLAAARAGIGAGRVLGLRLSCDELAPWAGITPEMAVDVAVALSEDVDYLVVTRGSIFSIEQTRPDVHVAPGFNWELGRAVRAALVEHRPGVAVVLQGSIVDPAMAEAALADGVADLVEMTRAQIADAELGLKLAAGLPERVRPCIRCNQACQVRDARNPLVSCVVDPSTGHETEDPDWTAPAPAERRHAVLVVGGGPAGLETARVAAERGHRVRLVERAPVLGGAAAIAGPGGPFVAWQARECERLGVELVTGTEVGPAEVSAADVAVVCTGGRAGRREYEGEVGALVVDAIDWFAHPELVPADGPILVWDPIGANVAVEVGERLGERAVLVTPSYVVGDQLARTGDLAPANVRLQQRGVHLEKRAILRSVGVGVAVVEDRFTGARRTIECGAVIDCGARLPEDELWRDAGARALRAGDAVAPRTILEAVLEGRRAGLAL